MGYNDFDSRSVEKFTDPANLLHEEAGHTAEVKRRPTEKKKKTKKQKQADLVIKPPKICFNVFHTQYDLIKEIAKKCFSWKLSHRDPWNTNIEWDIIWSDTAPSLQYWKEMKPFQKINHFPGMY